MIKLDTVSIYSILEPEKGLLVYNSDCNQIWRYNGYEWGHAMDHLGFVYDIDAYKTHVYRIRI